MKLSAAVLAPVSLGLFAFSMGGTKEEIIRLQSDVLQLSNQIRMLQKSTDETGSVFQSLLEQLNDQVAQMNLATDELHRTMQDQKTDVFNLVTSIRSEVQNLSVKLDDTNNRLASVQKQQEEQQLRMQSLRTAPASAEGMIQPDQAYAARLQRLHHRQLRLGHGRFSGTSWTATRTASTATTPCSTAASVPRSSNTTSRPSKPSIKSSICIPRVTRRRPPTSRRPRSTSTCRRIRTPSTP